MAFSTHHMSSAGGSGRANSNKLYTDTLGASPSFPWWAANTAHAALVSTILEALEAFVDGTPNTCMALAKAAALVLGDDAGAQYDVDKKGEGMLGGNQFQGAGTSFDDLDDGGDAKASNAFNNNNSFQQRNKYDFMIEQFVLTAQLGELFTPIAPTACRVTPAAATAADDGNDTRSTRQQFAPAADFGVADEVKSEASSFDDLQQQQQQQQHLGGTVPLRTPASVSNDIAKGHAAGFLSPTPPPATDVIISERNAPTLLNLLRLAKGLADLMAYPSAHAVFTETHFPFLTHFFFGRIPKIGPYTACGYVEDEEELTAQGSFAPLPSFSLGIIRLLSLLNQYISSPSSTSPPLGEASTGSSNASANNASMAVPSMATRPFSSSADETAPKSFDSVPSEGAAGEEVLGSGGDDRVHLVLRLAATLPVPHFVRALVQGILGVIGSKLVTIPLNKASFVAHLYYRHPQVLAAMAARNREGGSSNSVMSQRGVSGGGHQRNSGAASTSNNGGHHHQHHRHGGEAFMLPVSVIHLPCVTCCANVRSARASLIAFRDHVCLHLVDLLPQCCDDHYLALTDAIPDIINVKNHDADTTSNSPSSTPPPTLSMRQRGAPSSSSCGTGSRFVRASFRQSCSQFSAAPLIEHFQKNSLKQVILEACSLHSDHNIFAIPLWGTWESSREEEDEEAGIGDANRDDQRRPSPAPPAAAKAPPLFSNSHLDGDHGNMSHAYRHAFDDDDDDGESNKRPFFFPIDTSNEEEEGGPKRSSGPASVSPATRPPRFNKYGERMMRADDFERYRMRTQLVGELRSAQQGSRASPAPSSPPMVAPSSPPLLSGQQGGGILDEDNSIEEDGDTFHVRYGRVITHRIPSALGDGRDTDPTLADDVHAAPDVFNTFNTATSKTASSTSVVAQGAAIASYVTAAAKSSRPPREQSSRSSDPLAHPQEEGGTTTARPLTVFASQCCLHCQLAAGASSAFSSMDVDGVSPSLLGATAAAEKALIVTTLQEHFCRLYNLPFVPLTEPTRPSPIQLLHHRLWDIILSFPPLRRLLFIAPHANTVCNQPTVSLHSVAEALGIIPSNSAPQQKQQPFSFDPEAPFVFPTDEEMSAKPTKPNTASGGGNDGDGDDECDLLATCLPPLLVKKVVEEVAPTPDAPSGRVLVSVLAAVTPQQRLVMRDAVLALRLFYHSQALGGGDGDVSGDDKQTIGQASSRRHPQNLPLLQSGVAVDVDCYPSFSPLFYRPLLQTLLVNEPLARAIISTDPTHADLVAAGLKLVAHLRSNRLHNPDDFAVVAVSGRHVVAEAGEEAASEKAPFAPRATLFGAAQESNFGGGGVVGHSPHGNSPPHNNGDAAGDGFGKGGASANAVQSALAGGGKRKKSIGVVRFQEAVLGGGGGRRRLSKVLSPSDTKGEGDFPAVPQPSNGSPTAQKKAGGFWGRFGIFRRGRGGASNGANLGSSGSSVFKSHSKGGGGGHSSSPTRSSGFRNSTAAAIFKGLISRRRRRDNDDDKNAATVVEGQSILLQQAAIASRRGKTALNRPRDGSGGTTSARNRLASPRRQGNSGSGNLPKRSNLSSSDDDSINSNDSFVTSVAAPSESGTPIAPYGRNESPNLHRIASFSSLLTGRKGAIDGGGVESMVESFEPPPFLIGCALGGDGLQTWDDSSTEGDDSSSSSSSSSDSSVNGRIAADKRGHAKDGWVAIRKRRSVYKSRLWLLRVSPIVYRPLINAFVFTSTTERSRIGILNRQRTRVFDPSVALALNRMEMLSREGGKGADAAALRSADDAMRKASLASAAAPPHQRKRALSAAGQLLVGLAHHQPLAQMSAAAAQRRGSVAATQHAANHRGVSRQLNSIEKSVTSSGGGGVGFGDGGESGGEETAGSVSPPQNPFAALNAAFKSNIITASPPHANGEGEEDGGGEGEVNTMGSPVGRSSKSGMASRCSWSDRGAGRSSSDSSDEGDDEEGEGNRLFASTQEYGDEQEEGTKDNASPRPTRPPPSHYFGGGGRGDPSRRGGAKRRMLPKSAFKSNSRLSRAQVHTRDTIRDHSLVVSMFFYPTIYDLDTCINHYWTFAHNPSAAIPTIDPSKSLVTVIESVERIFEVFAAAVACRCVSGTLIHGTFSSAAADRVMGRLGFVGSLEKPTASASSYSLLHGLFGDGGGGRGGGDNARLPTSQDWLVETSPTEIVSEHMAAAKRHMSNFSLRCASPILLRQGIGRGGGNNSNTNSVTRRTSSSNRGTYHHVVSPFSPTTTLTATTSSPSPSAFEGGGQHEKAMAVVSGQFREASHTLYHMLYGKAPITTMAQLQNQLEIHKIPPHTFLAAAKPDMMRGEGIRRRGRRASLLASSSPFFLFGHPCEQQHLLLDGPPAQQVHPAQDTAAARAVSHRHASARRHGSMGTSSSLSVSPNTPLNVSVEGAAAGSTKVGGGLFSNLLAKVAGGIGAALLGSMAAGAHSKSPMNQSFGQTSRKMPSSLLFYSLRRGGGGGLGGTMQFGKGTMTRNNFVNPLAADGGDADDFDDADAFALRNNYCKRILTCGSQLLHFRPKSQTIKNGVDTSLSALRCWMRLKDAIQRETNSRGGNGMASGGSLVWATHALSHVCALQSSTLLELEMGTPPSILTTAAAASAAMVRERQKIVKKFKLHRRHPLAFAGDPTHTILGIGHALTSLALGYAVSSTRFFSAVAAVIGAQIYANPPPQLKQITTAHQDGLLLQLGTRCYLVRNAQEFFFKITVALPGLEADGSLGLQRRLASIMAATDSAINTMVHATSVRLPALWLQWRVLLALINRGGGVNQPISFILDDSDANRALAAVVSSSFSAFGGVSASSSLGGGGHFIQSDSKRAVVDELLSVVMSMDFKNITSAVRGGEGPTRGSNNNNKVSGDDESDEGMEIGEHFDDDGGSGQRTSAYKYSIAAFEGMFDANTHQAIKANAINPADAPIAWESAFRSLASAPQFVPMIIRARVAGLIRHIIIPTQPSTGGDVVSPGGGENKTLRQQKYAIQCDHYLHEHRRPNLTLSNDTSTPTTPGVESELLVSPAAILAAMGVCTTSVGGGVTSTLSPEEASDMATNAPPSTFSTSVLAPLMRDPNFSPLAALKQQLAAARASAAASRQGGAAAGTAVGNHDDDDVCEDKSEVFSTIVGAAEVIDAIHVEIAHRVVLQHQLDIIAGQQAMMTVSGMPSRQAAGAFAANPIPRPSLAPTNPLASLNNSGKEESTQPNRQQYASFSEWHTLFAATTINSIDDSTARVKKGGVDEGGVHSALEALSDDFYFPLSFSTVARHTTQILSNYQVITDTAVDRCLSNLVASTLRRSSPAPYRTRSSSSRGSTSDGVGRSRAPSVSKRGGGSGHHLSQSSDDDDGETDEDKQQALQHAASTNDVFSVFASRASNTAPSHFAPKSSKGRGGRRIRHAYEGTSDDNFFGFDAITREAVDAIATTLLTAVESMEHRRAHQNDMLARTATAPPSSGSSASALAVMLRETMASDALVIKQALVQVMQSVVNVGWPKPVKETSGALGPISSVALSVPRTQRLVVMIIAPLLPIIMRLLKLVDLCNTTATTAAASVARDAADVAALLASPYGSSPPPHHEIMAQIAVLHRQRRIYDTVIDGNVTRSFRALWLLISWADMLTFAARAPLSDPYAIVCGQSMKTILQTIATHAPPLLHFVSYDFNAAITDAATLFDSYTQSPKGATFISFSSSQQQRHGEWGSDNPQRRDNQSSQTTFAGNSNTSGSGTMGSRANAAAADVINFIFIRKRKTFTKISNNSAEKRLVDAIKTNIPLIHDGTNPTSMNPKRALTMYIRVVKTRLYTKHPFETTDETVPSAIVVEGNLKLALKKISGREKMLLKALSDLEVVRASTGAPTTITAMLQYTNVQLRSFELTPEFGTLILALKIRCVDLLLRATCATPPPLSIGLGLSCAVDQQPSIRCILKELVFKASAEMPLPSAAAMEMSLVIAKHFPGVATDSEIISLLLLGMNAMQSGGAGGGGGMARGGRAPFRHAPSSSASRGGDPLMAAEERTLLHNYTVFTKAWLHISEKKCPQQFLESLLAFLSEQQDSQLLTLGERPAGTSLALATAVALTEGTHLGEVNGLGALTSSVRNFSSILIRRGEGRSKCSTLLQQAVLFQRQRRGGWGGGNEPHEHILALAANELRQSLFEQMQLVSSGGNFINCLRRDDEGAGDFQFNVWEEAAGGNSSRLLAGEGCAGALRSHIKSLVFATASLLLAPSVTASPSSLRMRGQDPSLRGTSAEWLQSQGAPPNLFETTIIRQLVEGPVQVFTAVSVHTAVECWQWLLSERPSLAPLLLTHIVAAIQWTVTQRLGLFDGATPNLLKYVETEVPTWDVALLMGAGGDQRRWAESSTTLADAQRIDYYSRMYGSDYSYNSPHKIIISFLATNYLNPHNSIASHDRRILASLGDLAQAVLGDNASMSLKGSSFSEYMAMCLLLVKTIQRIHESCSAEMAKTVPPPVTLPAIAELRRRLYRVLLQWFAKPPTSWYQGGGGSPQRAVNDGYVLIALSEALSREQTLLVEHGPNGFCGAGSDSLAPRDLYLWRNRNAVVNGCEDTFDRDTPTSGDSSNFSRGGHPRRGLYAETTSPPFSTREYEFLDMNFLAAPTTLPSTNGKKGRNGVNFISAFDESKRAQKQRRKILQSLGILKPLSGDDQKKATQGESLCDTANDEAASPSVNNGAFESTSLVLKPNVLQRRCLEHLYDLIGVIKIFIRHEHERLMVWTLPNRSNEKVAQYFPIHHRAEASSRGIPLSSVNVAVDYRQFIQSISEQQWEAYIIAATTENPRAAVSLTQRLPSFPVVPRLVRAMVCKRPLLFKSIPSAASLYVCPETLAASGCSELVTWAPTTIIEALRLVSLPYQRFPFVMQYGVTSLLGADARHLIFYLPQLLQCLGFDFSGAIEGFLREQAKQSVDFSHQLLWLLTTEAGDEGGVENELDGTSPHHGDSASTPTKNAAMSSNSSPSQLLSSKCAQLKREIVSDLSPSHLAFYENEFNYIATIISVSNQLKATEKKERKAVLRRMLRSDRRSFHDPLHSSEQIIYLPTDSTQRMVGLLPETAGAMQSAAKCPILVQFKCVPRNPLDVGELDDVFYQREVEDDGEEVDGMRQRGDHSFAAGVRDELSVSRQRNEAASLPVGVKGCIFKYGDDCRQDQIAIQLIHLFKRIFESVAIPCFLYPYRVVTTAPNCGVIECVPNTMSRDQIGKLVESNLGEYFIQKYGHPQSERFKAARQCFIESAASYSVASFILNIKDRHNGNILIDDEGHIIHIDFGFLFDLSPGGDINFESSPFKLTEEMLQLMGDAGDGKNRNAAFALGLRPQSAAASASGSEATSAFGAFGKNIMTALPIPGMGAPTGTFTEPMTALVCPEAYDYFVATTVQCYLACRQYTREICTLVELLLESKLPCFKPMKTIADLVWRLGAGLTEHEAAEFMRARIVESRNNMRTNLYDKYQNIWEGIEM